MPHECALSLKLAIQAGHIHRLNKATCDIAIVLVRAAAFRAHFSPVKYQDTGGGVNRVLYTSTRMLEVLHRFTSSIDDTPETSLHAALVFSDLYPDPVATVLGVMAMELREAPEPIDGPHSIYAGSAESGLVNLLRANGVRSPARAFANLLPHVVAALNRNSNREN
ncbi:MAG: hypothetical protein WAV09_03195 [Minisyncoccia bacterium]